MTAVPSNTAAPGQTVDARRTFPARNTRMKPLNLFYEEPDPDRWLPLDRYPRRALRRLIRGPARVGGQQRVFLNLCAGLDRLGVPYRVNDYRYALRNPEEVAGVVGKPHVLDKVKWRNPILFGASIFSHPLEAPGFQDRYPTVAKILVPGEWMRRMMEPEFGAKVAVWPVGIDTELWSPSSEKTCDFLIYDKVRWEHDAYERTLLEPIRAALRSRGLKVVELRYGFYEEENFRALLRTCRAMVFLCEHETQGIAYQQALSCGVPILAWDRGGFWQDPTFYPARVQFAPVSAVPYWDERCGVKFEKISDFGGHLDRFLAKLQSEEFAPRAYISENLTLEQSAASYLEKLDEVRREASI